MGDIIEGYHVPDREGDDSDYFFEEWCKRRDRGVAAAWKEIARQSVENKDPWYSIDDSMIDGGINMEALVMAILLETEKKDENRSKKKTETLPEVREEAPPPAIRDPRRFRRFGNIGIEDMEIPALKLLQRTVARC